MVSYQPYDDELVECCFMCPNGKLKLENSSGMYDMITYEWMDVDLLQWYVNAGLCKTEEELYELGSDAVNKFTTEEKAITTLITKSDVSGGFLEVKNSGGKRRAGNLKVGRVYPVDNVSIRSFRSSLRQLMTFGNMVEIDVVNCHPTIAYQVGLKLKVDVATLKSYCDDRDSFRMDVMDKYDVNKNQAKSLFITILFGGSFHSWFMKEKEPELWKMYKEDKAKCLPKLPCGVEVLPKVSKFEKEVKQLMSKVKAVNDELAKVIERTKGSSILAYFFQHVELLILTTVQRTLKKRGLIKCVWMPLHDGLFAPQSLVNPNDKDAIANLCRILRKEVFDELKIFVNFEIKGTDLDDTSKDILRSISAKVMGAPQIVASDEHNRMDENGYRDAIADCVDELEFAKWYEYFDERNTKLVCHFDKLDKGFKLPPAVGKQKIKLEELDIQPPQVDSNIEKYIKDDFKTTTPNKIYYDTGCKRATVVIDTTQGCLFNEIEHNGSKKCVYEKVVIENETKDVKETWMLQSYECPECDKKMSTGSHGFSTLHSDNVRTNVHELLERHPLFIEFAPSNAPRNCTRKIFDTLRETYEVTSGEVTISWDTPILTSERINLVIKCKGHVLLDRTIVNGPVREAGKYNESNLQDLGAKVMKPDKNGIALSDPEILRVNDGETKEYPTINFRQDFLQKWKSDQRLTYFMKASTGSGKTKAIIGDILPKMYASTRMIQPCPRVTLGSNTTLRYNNALADPGFCFDLEPKFKRRKVMEDFFVSQRISRWDIRFYKDTFDNDNSDSNIKDEDLKSKNGFKVQKEIKRESDRKQVKKIIDLSKKVVIQVDSMHYCDPMKTYDVVIIDELGSVLKQFLSIQIEFPKAVKALDILKSYVKNAKVLIAMDADLSAFEVELMLEWRGKAGLGNLIYGSHAVATFAAKKFRIVHYQTLVQEYLRDLFFREKKVIFPCSSKRQLAYLESRVIQFAQGIIDINGLAIKNGYCNPNFKAFKEIRGYDDEKARSKYIEILNGFIILNGDSRQSMKKHFLESERADKWNTWTTTTKWMWVDDKSYKLERKDTKENNTVTVRSFHYSPTLMTGMSIEDGYFDVQFGLFVSSSVAAAGVSQMSHRDRKINTCTIAVVQYSNVLTQDQDTCVRERDSHVALQNLINRKEWILHAQAHLELDRLRMNYNSEKLASERELKTEVKKALNENNFASEIFDNNDVPLQATSTVEIEFDTCKFNATKMFNTRIPNNYKPDTNDDGTEKKVHEKYWLQEVFGKFDTIDEIAIVLHIRPTIDRIWQFFRPEIDPGDKINTVTPDHAAKMSTDIMECILMNCGFIDQKKYITGKELASGFLMYVFWSHEILSKNDKKIIKARMKKLEEQKIADSAWATKNRERFVGLYAYQRKKNERYLTKIDRKKTADTSPNWFRELKDLTTAKTFFPKHMTPKDDSRFNFASEKLPRIFAGKDYDSAVFYTMVHWLHRRTCRDKHTEYMRKLKEKLLGEQIESMFEHHKRFELQREGDMKRKNTENQHVREKARERGNPQDILKRYIEEQQIFLNPISAAV